MPVTEADVLDPSAIEPSVADADAVLSALGPRRGDSAITADAVASITRAMKGAGVRRIVAVSAAPIAPPGPVDPFVYKRIARPPLWRFLGAGYRSPAAMEQLLAAGGLDWTVMRPAMPTDGPRTGAAEYVLDYSRPGAFRISRADLAEAMPRVLDDPRSAGRFVRFR